MANYCNNKDANLLLVEAVKRKKKNEKAKKYIYVTSFIVITEKRRAHRGKKITVGVGNKI